MRKDKRVKMGGLPNLLPSVSTYASPQIAGDQIDLLYSRPFAATILLKRQSCNMPNTTDGVGGAVEKVTLRDVTHQGGVLVLEDGRSLRVHPGDTSATTFWMPTTKLEISQDDISLAFPLNIHNTLIRSNINATWTK